MPVARRLYDNYSVLVVFDAVIRQKLKMGDQDIAATIGGQYESPCGGFEKEGRRNDT